VSVVRGPLKTEGNLILDGLGHPLTLRGVVSDWLDWQPSIANFSPLDDSSIGRMKQWGANTVRVLLSEEFWNSNDCQFVPSYAANVDRVVESITSRGMVALLNLHNNARHPCQPSNQQRMADYPGSVAFWQSVANRYRTNPLVAFDLYNEPHDITWSQWLNGGTLVDSDGVVWQAAGMQQLYDAVRSQGALNLVFASGNQWGNLPPPDNYLHGFNIVYAAHYYTCSSAPATSCTTPDPYNPAPPGQRLDAWTPTTKGHAVVVTEFGWPDPTSGTYNQNVINWAESRHVGWTAYGWYTGIAGGKAAFGILNDMNTFEPTPSGVPVKAGIEKGLFGLP
jgi:aryl-phospho-beta-D-glucosidase BglC (GH1 family)